MKKKLVILSGAGISAESGLQTFRGSDDGLWNNFKIEDVCTSDAFERNPTLVNDFYNMRRIEVLNASPNDAHYICAELESYFDVDIITTNIDDLHERAGSLNIMHLHGEILKARSSHEKYDWMGMSHDDSINNPKLVDVGREGIKPFQNAHDGSLLRPYVVFFGESVTKINDAADVIKEADILVVVGTSLNVYPAASLVWSTKDECKTYYIDPYNDDAATSFPCRHIKMTATKGMEELYDILLLDNLLD